MPPPGTHFEYAGPVLAGRTPTGRATIRVLAINDPARVELRRVVLAGEPEESGAE